MYRWPVPSSQHHTNSICSRSVTSANSGWSKNTAAVTSRTSGRGHPRLGEHPKLSSRFHDEPPASTIRADAVRPPHEISRVRRCRARTSRRFRRICQWVRWPRKPEFAATTTADSEKESDAEVKAKKQEAGRIARGRRGLGATINTSGTGAQGTAPTQRATLLGD